ncbi:sialate O-acetylesterase [Streptomyces scopuliridis]|uniref:sialate O-acetylesterase n=1 Tax=Streptomyces scopuliridis TaxID=452529 RepID=UPI00367F6FEB
MSHRVLFLRRLVTLAAAGALAAAVLGATAPPAVSTSAATAADGATACDSHASGLVPVYGLTLPAHGGGLAEHDLATTFDNSSAVVGGFDRVGYCLELDGPSGPQWVWTAMPSFTKDTRQLLPPTKSGHIVRQRVHDLNTASNVAGVPTATGGTGYLEMWPNSYGPANARQIHGSSTSTFDSDDTPRTDVGRGSFQIHRVSPDPLSGSAPSTVLAVNGLTQVYVLPVDVGIGNQPTGNPDWTYAANATGLTKRTLTVFARPSVVELDAAPQDDQLYPRDDDNLGHVDVNGTVTDARVTHLKLTVRHGTTVKRYHEKARRGERFTFDAPIAAGLREYRVELRASGPGFSRTVADWTGIVAGDAVVIQGQSNATASGEWADGAAEAFRSRWVRAYGTTEPDPTLSTTDRAWHWAEAEKMYNAGSAGQWGVRMAAKLVEDEQVPIAVFNGAHSGMPISFFQRDDANPGSSATNYGRLRQRLEASGLLAHVRAVLFYQGESEQGNAAVHTTGVTNLVNDWRTEFGTSWPVGATYNIFQVRTSPCNSTEIALRDAERRLRGPLDVNILSTTAYNGHDGCHYKFADGYEPMGVQAADVLSRDLYGGPSDGVSAPDVASVRYGNAAHTQLVLPLRNADPLTVEPGAAADFQVDGTTVNSVAWQSGTLVLSLSTAPTAGGTARYLCHIKSGPRLMTARGVGLLAFREDLPTG